MAVDNGHEAGNDNGIGFIDRKDKNNLKAEQNKRVSVRKNASGIMG